MVGDVTWWALKKVREAPYGLVGSRSRAHLRCGEMWGDVGRCAEMCGDVRRYGGLGWLEEQGARVAEEQPQRVSVLGAAQVARETRDRLRGGGAVGGALRRGSE